MNKIVGAIGKRMEAELPEKVLEDINDIRKWVIAISFVADGNVSF